MKWKVSLTIQEGPDTGHTFDLGSGIHTIGRKGTSILLSDKKISTLHCQIKVDAKGATLHDHGSTNGTLINGKKVLAPTLLQNLDKITLGFTQAMITIVENLDEFLDNKKAVSAADAFSGSTAILDQNSGMIRIDSLIKEELDSFSKWQFPAQPTEGGLHSLPKVQVILKPISGPMMTTIECTKPITTLGRKEVDIRVADLDCSRKHVAIEIIAGEKVYARDLGSTNGSYVNGQKISHQLIKSGDKLLIGKSVFEIEIIKS